MKRISYIFIDLMVTALVLAPACSKDSPSPKDEMPEWVTDLTKSVPIILGTGSPSVVKTKAAITSLSNVEFGVLALDTTNNANVELFRNEVAYGAQANVAQFFSKKTGADTTMYYPLYNPNSYNYSFFAWHTSDTTVVTKSKIFDLDANAYTKTFEIGHVDVLWARADATPFVIGSGEEAKTYKGFNAEYQRTARKELGASWETYLPKLTFKHLTAALHFKVVAEDADAAATFIKNNVELVRLTDLKIFSVSGSGIPSSVILDVINGEMTTKNYAKNLAITAASLLPNVDAQEFGEGLFIMPTSDELRVMFTIQTPTGAYTPSESEDKDKDKGFPLNAPSAKGFEAGKSYTYKIIIRSLENIQIKLELEEWIEAPINDNVIATIG